MEVPKLRLQRAMEHIKLFDREVDVFLKTKPFGSTTEFYTEGGKKCIALRFKVIHEPPKQLGILAGECIHQLRAILDNLIWSLGELYPPVDPRIAFPVSLNPMEYQKAINNVPLNGIKNFPFAAQDLIERLQPYQGGYAGAPEIHPLNILNRLWNDDKHRAPHLMGGMSGGVALKGFTLQQPATLSAGLAIRNGVQFASGVIPEGGINPDAKIEFSSDVAFNIGAPAWGDLAVPGLMRLHNFIRDEVIAKFEPIFPKS